MDGESRIERRVQSAFPRPLQFGWAALLALTAVGAIFDRAHALPDRLSGGIAVLFASLIVAGLWARAGAIGWAATGLTLVYGAVAVGLHNDVMLRGAALVTAAVVAVFAMLVTVPAPRFRLAIVEVAIANVLALGGGFAVVAYHADVNSSAFRYAVLICALVGALIAVYRPGAGLQGLGRRGYALIGGLAALMIFAVAYSLALTHWGTHYVTDTVDDLRTWMHDDLGAAPHLLPVLIGVPSLCWGVFTRARRRQGWWMCAFGVALTVPAATAFVGGPVTGVALLGCLYSLILGAIVGFLVVRLEQIFTGSHGRRARRSEEASAHRPEPSRWTPLR